VAKPYKFTPSDIPARRTNSLYADVVSDFLAQGAESMEVQMENVKPETLRAGLRAAIKGRAEHDVRLVQRAEVTYLVRKPRTSHLRLAAV
jgi:hypothetical protein